MSRIKTYDMTDQVHAAWEHFDKILEAKIQHIHELTGVEKERLVKLNPLEFVERMDGQIINDYHFQDIGEWVTKHKTPDNFLISPIDEDIETANQIAYKTGQAERKLRAHKCEVMPISILAAKRFFVKNHRQSIPPLTGNSVNYALVYQGEAVAVMSYDLTRGAVRGLQNYDKYELMRLSIKHGTTINGGASKLEKYCEEAIRHQGCTDIFSYSNATINEGRVYQQLGFSPSSILGGQAWVVERDFTLYRLLACGSHGNNKGSKNSDLRRRYAIKVHVTANRTWIKDIALPESAE